MINSQNASLFFFQFVTKFRVVCCQTAQLALEEPGVEVDDSREGQLLLHPPLQVIGNLAHQPAPCLFFLPNTLLVKRNRFAQHAQHRHCNTRRDAEQCPEVKVEEAPSTFLLKCATH